MKKKALAVQLWHQWPIGSAPAFFGAEHNKNGVGDGRAWKPVRNARFAAQHHRQEASVVINNVCRPSRSQGAGAASPGSLAEQIAGCGRRGMAKVARAWPRGEHREIRKLTRAENGISRRDAAYRAIMAWRLYLLKK